MADSRAAAVRFPHIVLGEVPVMAVPGDEMAAGAGGRDHLRASHADREQVIGALKAAFVQGMVAKDEFDLRVGQTLAARTYADLAALTADLPAGLAAAKPPQPAPAQDGAVIPRPGIVLTVATVLYAGGIWALFLTGGGQGASALVGIATVFYFLLVIFAGAQLLESRQKQRSGGQPPRPPAPGVSRQASRRLPSAGPGGQLPPAGPGQQQKRRSCTDPSPPVARLAATGHHGYLTHPA
jgi:Domain of unknown function (DUF1707)